MIQLATPDMLPALREIWRTCFGDPEFYINHVFSCIAAPGDVLVSTDEDGKPSAMLCMQRAQLVSINGESCSCAYIYGVATHPDQQGKGLSTMLMEGAHRYLKKNGVSLSVLVPASESLFHFYEQRGYEPGFTMGKLHLTADQMPVHGSGMVLVPAGLGRLEKLRHASFSDSSYYLRWSREYLAAIDAECRLLGGEVLRYSYGGQEGYAVCYRHEQHVIVKENTAPDVLLPDLLAALHRRYYAEAYSLYLRSDRGVNFSPTILPFAVMKWYDNKMSNRILTKEGAPPWITHVLD